MDSSYHSARLVRICLAGNVTLIKPGAKLEIPNSNPLCYMVLVRANPFWTSTCQKWIKKVYCRGGGIKRIYLVVMDVSKYTLVKVSNGRHDCEYVSKHVLVCVCVCVRAPARACLGGTYFDAFWRPSCEALCRPSWALARPSLGEACTLDGVRSGFNVMTCICSAEAHPGIDSWLTSSPVRCTDKYTCVTMD